MKKTRAIQYAIAAMNSRLAFHNDELAKLDRMPSRDMRRVRFHEAQADAFGEALEVLEAMSEDEWRTDHLEEIRQ